MANSSILGGTRAPQRPDGTGVDAFGPSDTSDSGSDIQGESTMPTSPDNPAELGALPVDPDSDSDAFGTGERAQAAGRAPREAGDIMPDRIVDDPQGDLLDEEQAEVDDLVDSLSLDDDEGSAATQDPEAVGSEDEDRAAGGRDNERAHGAARR